jgi:hypothetical protein
LAVDVERYQRQILLAPIGGAGQQRIATATIVLHGAAPLCATYLAAAGLGTLRVTGARPEIAAHDPAFRMEAGDRGDFTLDLGDGSAWRAAEGPRLWGGVVGGVLKLGVEPEAGATVSPVLETLAAGEVLLRLLGQEPHPYEFRLHP